VNLEFKQKEDRYTVNDNSTENNLKGFKTEILRTVAFQKDC